MGQSSGRLPRLGVYLIPGARHTVLRGDWRRLASTAMASQAVRMCCRTGHRSCRPPVQLALVKRAREGGAAHACGSRASCGGGGGAGQQWDGGAGRRGPPL